MIAWVYGSGFPKSLNIGKAVDKLQGNERESIGKKLTGTMAGQNGNLNAQNWWKGGQEWIEDTKGTSEWEWWWTALKPALEPITVARKPLGEKTVAENCLKWGVGGINIDGCRVSTEDKMSYSSSEKQGVTQFGTGTTEQSPLGRFPANLIHDGSDEVVELFPNTKSGAVKQFTNNGANQPINLGGGMLKPTEGSEGSASRFFYCAKASKSERNKGCEELEEKKNVEHRFGRYRCKLCGKLQLDHNPCICDSPDLERIEVNNGNNHPTVKPIALMEYLVKLVSREWALVLDPFAWSGSTLIACKNTNRGYVGIEMDEEYIKIIEARLASSI